MTEVFLKGIVSGLLVALIMVLIVPVRRQRRSFEDYKFKPNDKRTKLIARLGGYSRHDRDGIRYPKSKR